MRRVSVNSFGYGGTNGHAILDYPGNSTCTKLLQSINNHNERQNGSSCVEGWNSHIFALTAKNEHSLVGIATKLRQWVEAQIDSNDSNLLSGLAYTLTTRRSIMRWRYCFAATSGQEIAAQLDEKSIKPMRSGEGPNIFVFTGQGSQWYAMGRELMVIGPYRDSMLKSSKILCSLGANWNLIDELDNDEDNTRVNNSGISQPATTALQIALVELLMKSEIEPDFVVGHSSGEIAAAYASGAINQTTALQVAYYRGLLKPTTKGAMLAVGLGAEKASGYVSQIKTGVATVSCSNSPSSSTISGDIAAIEELEVILNAASIFARRLKVDVAYHSHHVQDLSEEYMCSLGDLEIEAPRKATFISSVTTNEMTAGFGSDYWVKNLVSRVRFREALEQISTLISSDPALSSSVPKFIEIGPHNALSGPIRQTMEKSNFPRIFNRSVLSRKRNGLSTWLALSSRLFEQGCNINLSTINRLLQPDEKPTVLTCLPPYAWDHSNGYWHESRLSKAHRFRQFPYHDLLGVRVPASLKPLWRHILNLNSLPWLREHIIDGVVIFPAAGYVCMAIEALRQLLAAQEDTPVLLKYVLKDVSFISSLTIPNPPQSVELQITLDSETNNKGSGWKEFCLTSVSAGEVCVEHCHGLIAAKLKGAADEDEVNLDDQIVAEAQAKRLARLQSEPTESLEGVDLYNQLKDKGNYYGPNFACVDRLKINESNALGSLVIPNTKKCMPEKFIQPHVIHPGTLDALLHACIPLFKRQRRGAQSVMATNINKISISASLTNTPLASLTTATTLTHVASRSAAAEICAFQTNDKGGKEAVVHITEAELHATGKFDEEIAGRDMNYRMKWDLDAEHLTSSLFRTDRITNHGEEQAQAQKVHDLNKAAAFYVAACLEKLSEQDIELFKGHYRTFFEWMNKFRGGHKWCDLTSGISKPSDIEGVFELAQDLGVEGKMLCRVGEKLPEILTGKVDPLALMVSDGLLYRLYADDSSAKCYAHMIHYFQHAVFKDPNMTVLELGAGTGGKQFLILNSLFSIFYFFYFFFLKKRNNKNNKNKSTINVGTQVLPCHYYKPLARTGGCL